MVQRRDGRLRADAARNRERLVAAAREVFSEHGLDVSMRQIARHAGVSEPTLRRRFAGRDELLAAVFEDKLVLYAEIAEAALKQDDAWAGFTGYVRWVARAQLADRGFADVLTRTFPASLGYEQYRRRAWAAVEELITRAKAAGGLRADFSAEDIPLLLLAHAGVLAGAGRVAERMSDRLLAYFLQAFAAPGGGPLPPAPSAAETYHALMKANREK
ncbi:TetR family transcriptional regulator [Actinoplanes sp. NBRC 14428]|uniref:TetR family transcriptional regulator n=1 Tax=Pseudosporangium ferrugineum TaxID=439699 RepID=A0A2T0SFL9_9ACTN|nr:TetR/AcrR family transcriptional regulator [Pseudosporangium ferrugineum]PRY32209.1 TetR family transcriptional regulator [Pseudosporangium ferrugineum]BCJ49546.1 TetR family transcriptional regulator [Actinoplanes sp. NBRC 14428]